MKLKKFNFKIVNSTNNLAIQIIKNTNNKSGIVIAEKQKKGRGQYGKKWTSFKGNLFVSIFFQVNMVQLSLYNLTKINCLLVKKLLSNCFVDVLAGDRITALSLSKDKVRFFYNGSKQCDLEILDIRRKFFSIWLGNDTRDIEGSLRLQGLK